MSKIFGERLKELRESENISQLKFAQIMLSSQASVSKWENNVQEPSYEILCKIAVFFNTTTDYLLGLDE